MANNNIEMDADTRLTCDNDAARFIVAVDIGTTTIRSHVYNHDVKVIGKGSRRIKLLYPKPGFVELDEGALYEQFVAVVKESLEAAKIGTNKVAALGISTQRNTFITWDKETGTPFHHFISWQDARSDDYCKAWNRSFTVRAIRSASNILYKITGKKKYLATSVFYFKNESVPMRLLWMYDNIPRLRERSHQGQVLFGTIETWLLWKLTGGQKHLVDISSASTTLLYDSFVCEWSTFIMKLINIEADILPEVCDTAGLFGETLPEIFGVPIQIMAMAGDQQAAMFGECCFDIGDVKCTMGTGTFIDVNTGDKPHASVNGIYPLVGWKYNDELVYLAEGNSADTGTAVSWGQLIGLFSDPSESSDIAGSVPDSNGLCFVPAFSGLQAPINDVKACAGFLGLTPTTSKEHMVRAILESLAFRVQQLFQTILDEASFHVGNMRVDGGVSNNNFLMQLIADLINRQIDRTLNKDMSSHGAAFLAGMAAGMWTKNDMKRFRKSECLFKPNPEPVLGKYEPIIKKWNQAIKACCNWYT